MWSSGHLYGEIINETRLVALFSYLLVQFFGSQLILLKTLFAARNRRYLRWMTNDTHQHWRVIPRPKGSAEADDLYAMHNLGHPGWGKTGQYLHVAVSIWHKPNVDHSCSKHSHEVPVCKKCLKRVKHDNQYTAKTQNWWTRFFIGKTYFLCSEYIKAYSMWY